LAQLFHQLPFSIGTPLLQNSTMNAPDSSYIRFALVDMNGKELSKVVPARHRENPVYMYIGVMGMGANAKVLTIPKEVMDAGCPNSSLVPDWDTEQVLPWACRRGVVVKRVWCEQRMGNLSANMSLSNAELNRAVPRTACRCLLDELRAFEGRGLEFLSGGELEFTLLKEDAAGTWQPYFQGVDLFATMQNVKAENYFFDLDRDMSTVGVDFLTFNAEYGAGQVELSFVPRLGIQALDNIATFRQGAKEVASRGGLRATFMSRPFGVAGVGNGGHFNFSLWSPTQETQREPSIISGPTKGYRSEIHSAEDALGLSATAKSFLAGILAHAPAMEAFAAPTPPCYTRHGNWAPVRADWGAEHRLSCVRVKSDPQGSPDFAYMEYRAPSASANAYLVAASLIAAGLDGLQRKLELPAAGDEAGATLPTDLPSALAALEADQYMVSKLSPTLVSYYKLMKEGEIAHLESLPHSTDEEVSAAWREMYCEYV